MNATDDQQNPHVEIRPDVTVLSVLRHLNYKPWFAIAEFIDNSLESFLTEREKLDAASGGCAELRVDIVLDVTAPGKITITDNAGGIPRSAFPRAFRAAQAPDLRDGLSEFGMGMKSAACWFAKRWSVRTSALGESVERSVHFDVASIVSNKTEALQIHPAPAEPHSHYTVVTLHELHHPPQKRTIGKIKDHLTSIYRIFLQDGRLVLRFNGEILKYEGPKILKSVRYTAQGTASQSEGSSPTVWRKDIRMDFGDGQKVWGFAALREVGSTSLAGFALFRRDRLVVGSFDETYRPHQIFKQTTSYAYQRLFGELHVEGFEVSHTKDGLRWEQYEDIFLEFLKHDLESEPLNLLEQAENYRALPSRKSIASRAASATGHVAEHLEQEVEPVLRENREAPAKVAELPTHLPQSDLQASERTVTLNDGTYLWIVTLRTNVDPAQDDWLALSKSENEKSDPAHTRRITIELALAHPFSSKFIGSSNENVELLLRAGTAFSLSLLLTEDIEGTPPHTALYFVNTLVRGALQTAGVSP